MKLLSNIFGLDPVEESYPLPVPPSSTIEYHPIPDSLAKDQLDRLLSILPYSLDVRRSNGPWIAGGAARRLLQGKDLLEGDIDFFFPSWKAWHAFDIELLDYESIIKTRKAHTYRVDGFKVQIIKRRTYAHLPELFGDFDFSACQIATDGKEIAVEKKAYHDIQNNILDFATVGHVSHLTVVGRMIKYLNHGFQPSPNVFAMAVSAGLDTFGPASIFGENGGFGDTSIYDLDEELPEDSTPTSEMNTEILRKVAMRMGLEIGSE